MSAIGSWVLMGTLITFSILLAVQFENWTARLSKDKESESER